MYPYQQRHSGRVFGNFERLRRELDAAFSRGTAPIAFRSSSPAPFPAINVSQSEASIEVQAFAPGIRPGQIEITIDRGVLTLTGERPATLPASGLTAESKVTMHSQERSTGRFKRAIRLPDDADSERVTAAYRDGVLHISVARREAAQPKRITIQ